ncbi:hypothetical protein G3I01_06525 [Gramella sp. MT6]|nr:hypothetical protein G3I01_06525 [Gramella sp. MT6]
MTSDIFININNKKSGWVYGYSWLMWIFTILIVFLIQLITLDDLFLIYKDQVQIIDYGRLILHPDSTWALTWQIAEEKPILIWSYLGPLIAEMSYHLGGQYGLGSRIAALIGGMLAATMAFGWLKSRNVPLYATYMLSLALLIDPLFVLSQRIGRMDSWVMALCFASCWILRSVSQKNLKINIMIAGGLAIIAGLIWPSAVFLYPLIFLELLNQKQVNAYKKSFFSWRLFFRKLGFFSLGAFIVGVVLLIPIWESLVTIFRDMFTMITRNINSTEGSSTKLLALFDYQVWLKLIKAYIKTLSIFFPILAILAVFSKREKGLLIATLLTIATIFATLVYELRALYLLPYFMVLSSGLYLNFKNILLKRLSNFGLFVLVMWAVAVSLIFKTVMANGSDSASHQERIFEIANSSIGPGEYKVFLGFNYEFYFAGRSLDWQLYSPYVKYEYDAEGNWISENKYAPEDKFVELLSKMDYAIFAENEVDNDLVKQIGNSGLVYSDDLVMKKDNNQFQNATINRNKEIILHYLMGDKTNNSFILFSRKPTNYEKKLNSKPEPAISKISRDQFNF